MSPQDITAIAKELAPLVATEVVARLGLTSAPVAVPTFSHRLTVPQFAACVQRGPEWVRLQIRSQVIPPNLLDGPPYLINPKALTKFGVTPEIAAERLAEWKRSHPAPVQTPPAVAQPTAA